MTGALAMLVVLFIAAVWGRWPGLAASVAGMLCLNYYFLPSILPYEVSPEVRVLKTSHQIQYASRTRTV
jgi:K+-sensing histidine kinase KdpD